MLLHEAHALAADGVSVGSADGPSDAEQLAATKKGEDTTRTLHGGSPHLEQPGPAQQAQGRAQGQDAVCQPTHLCTATESDTGHRQTRSHNAGLQGRPAVAVEAAPADEQRGAGTPGATAAGMSAQQCLPRQTRSAAKTAGGPHSQGVGAAATPGPKPERLKAADEPSTDKQQLERCTLAEATNAHRAESLMQLEPVSAKRVTRRNSLAPAAAPQRAPELPAVEAGCQIDANEPPVRRVRLMAGISPAVHGGGIGCACLGSG